MFNGQFTQELLEKIGGNSATIVLDKQGICEFASTAVAAVLGIEPEDLVGKNFVDAVPLFTLESQPVTELQHPVLKALNQKDFVQTTPFFCKLPLANAAADQNAIEPGNTLALKAIQFTENGKANYVLVQIRKAKREVDVGEMKSLFLSFAAHQLKTPSSVVKGFLELMIRQGEAAFSKEQWYFLTSAFESNENLIAVSKMLLNMTRLEGGLIEPNIHEFDPAKALSKKIASFESLFKTKGVNVELIASGQTPKGQKLRSDETFFLEIFGILLGNAVKHSPANSTIKVTYSVDENNCEVHVIDAGPGIAEGVRKNLFKSGQKPSEEENSHGLGLYMAKKYIALLNGRVGLVDQNPEEAEGSNFYFIVPNAQ
jgi:signal transduction histidine kinase